jgi:hypothetical protein
MLGFWADHVARMREMRSVLGRSEEHLEEGGIDRRTRLYQSWEFVSGHVAVSLRSSELGILGQWPTWSQ